MVRKLILILFLACATVAAQTQIAPVPILIGPVTGPGPVFPGLQRVPPGTGLSDRSYVVKEFFVSGTASGDVGPFAFSSAPTCARISLA